jgi:hypothetical protein
MQAFLKNVVINNRRACVAAWLRTACEGGAVPPEPLKNLLQTKPLPEGVRV